MTKRAEALRCAQHEIVQLMNEINKMKRENESHNTMRFDVQLAHIQPMIDMGMVDQQELSARIRTAIISVVDAVAGAGLDGIPIPGGAAVFVDEQSKMLHCEKILFDFS